MSGDGELVTELRLRPWLRCPAMHPILRLLLALLVLTLAQGVPALELKVKVRGLKGKYEENVLALLGIYQERKDKELSIPRLEALHRRATDQIRKALAPFGLYRVRVDATLTKPTSEDGAWVAKYKVVPGKPIKVRFVKYCIKGLDNKDCVTGEGADDSAFPKKFPMKKGDVFLHSEYEKAKKEILYLATRHGHLDHKLTRSRVSIDLDAYKADIEFRLDTGHPYSLGEVSFTQDLIGDRYLRRFIGFKPGDPYDPEALLTLQGRLIGMEYYKKVEIVPHKEAAGAERTVPIEVIATPNKANKYRLGLGYATDVGPRVTLEWRRRYLTRQGHRFKLETSISRPFQVLKSDYQIPIRNPLLDYLTIRSDLRVFDSAGRKGNIQSLKVAHSVLTPSGWRRTLGIDYHREQFEITADDRELVNELVPSITWSKRITDDPVYTRNGYKIKLALLGTLKGLISPASYLSGSARFKWIKSFRDDYRLIARSDLGMTWASSVFDLPASRRYFAGGDNSIRGWGLDVLGPNDLAINQNVGGRYLAVGSLELERRIKGNWSGAVFTDFGNAFDPDFTREAEVGAGLGVRWRSPIGQIRLDVAFALTKEGNPPRLHIVIGPDL